ncbi:hypothetical protein DSECCO2_132580 [anaerobic digester metagenome]
MYVSIKNRILTPSGQKSRVCVNTLDRLTHPTKLPPAFPSSTPPRGKTHTSKEANTCVLASFSGVA